MKELIEKLEAAEVGSRELDALVFCALNPGWREGRGIQAGAVIRAGSMRTPDLVTASLDAALALAERVLPNHKGWGIATHQENKFGAVMAHDPFGNSGGVEAYGKTPALALCIAILKAKSA